MHYYTRLVVMNSLWQGFLDTFPSQMSLRECRFRSRKLIERTTSVFSFAFQFWLEKSRGFSTNCFSPVLLPSLYRNPFDFDLVPVSEKRESNSDSAWLVTTSGMVVMNDGVVLLAIFKKLEMLNKWTNWQGRSSYELRAKYPHLKRMPSMWTRGYFHDTTGKVSTAVILAYINDPHHGK
jgi:hypothetical protein